MRKKLTEKKRKIIMKEEGRKGRGEVEESRVRESN